MRGEQAEHGHEDELPNVSRERHGFSDNSGFRLFPEDDPNDSDTLPPDPTDHPLTGGDASSRCGQSDGIGAGAHLHLMSARTGHQLACEFESKSRSVSYRNER